MIQKKRSKLCHLTLSKVAPWIELKKKIYELFIIYLFLSGNYLFATGQSAEFLNSGA